MADTKAMFEALTPEQQAKFLEGRSASDLDKIQSAGIEAPQSVSTVMDAVRGTDKYKNLLSKWFTEDQIISSISAYQKKMWINEPATQQPKTQVQPSTIWVWEQPKSDTSVIYPKTTEKPLDTSKIEEVKIADIVPKFWYETTMLERQDRNQNIAEALFSQNKTFNEAKIRDEIAALAPDVTAAEVQNTVNDIRDRFNALSKVDQLRTISSDVLAQNVVNWDMSLADLDGLKATDPAKYAEITGLISESNMITTNNAALDTMNALFNDQRITTAFDYLNTLNANYTNALKATDWEESLQTYKDALNDPALLEQKDKLAGKEWEVKELDLQLNDLRRSVEDEFKWASDSLINAVVADRGADLIRQKNSLLVETQTLATQVQNKITTAQNNYQLSLQQEQIERENIITSYGMDMKNFDMAWNVLNRQLDKEEKAYWNKKSLEDQITMMAIDDKYKRDYARFWYQLDNEFGGNLKYITDDNGNIRIFDWTSQVWYYWLNGDTLNNEVSEKLGTSFWAAWGSTRLNSTDPDWDISVWTGTELLSPVWWTIENVVKQADGNVQVQIRTNDGHLLSMNHLDDKTIDEFSGMIGQTINIWDKIWYTWHTGKIKTNIGGEWYDLTDDSWNPVPITFPNGKTAEQMIADGNWSHIDVRLLWPNWERYNWEQVRSFVLNWGMVQEQQEEALVQVSLSDMSAAEKDNLGFAARLSSATTIANWLNDYISWLTTTEFLLQENTPRALQNESYKQYDDAIREFVNAQLRQESWAAIWADEYDSARKEYFPVPWDTESILLQKSKRREQAVKTMLAKAWLQDFSQVQWYEQFSIAWWEEKQYNNYRDVLYDWWGTSYLDEYGL